MSARRGARTTTRRTTTRRTTTRRTTTRRATTRRTTTRWTTTRRTRRARLRRDPFAAIPRDAARRRRAPSRRDTDASPPPNGSSSRRGEPTASAPDPAAGETRRVCAARATLARREETATREDRVASRARATRAPVRDAPRQTSASAADERHPRVARVATRDWRERREGARFPPLCSCEFSRARASSARIGRLFDALVGGSSEALRSPHTHARVFPLASIARSPLTPRTPSHASARGP